MARVTTCDGTGAEIPEETPTTGLFGHQYSDEARPIAEEYLAALDALHSESATTFTAKLGELRAKYRSQLRELPDD